MADYKAPLRDMRFLLNDVFDAPALWQRLPRLAERIDADTADALKQMGAEHIDAPVDEIVEDSARKLVTTPAYMLAQSIAEAASGINKLVDRVLELVDQDKA